MKALGTGHSQDVLWRDVEVVRHGGPPQLQFHGGAARRFAAMGARSSLLTITHSETLALAQVLLLARVDATGVAISRPPAPRAAAAARPTPPQPACSLRLARALPRSAARGTALDASRVRPPCGRPMRAAHERVARSASR